MKEVTRPKVAIVGAGVAGLVLAICFERAGIPYTIYERAKEIKPLGSAIYLSASVAPLLIQLGLFDELTNVSKGVGVNTQWRESMKVAWSANHAERTKRFGYPGMILTRYDLYQILLSKVPADKIILRKRLLAIKQSVEEGATLKFVDGTSAQCELVVGADGAYSTTRQCIYEDLKENGTLPASDSLPLQVTSLCLVGTTLPLEPSLHPPLAEPINRLDAIMGDSTPHLWVLFTMPGNRIAFMVLKHVKVKEGQEEALRATEWSSKPAVDFANKVRHFKTPFGGELATLGDIFDKTDPTAMSKVMLEQKKFKTWHHGRVVLIGDAAHKMTPHTGQGATNAMFDAASLSSLLNDLDSNTPEGYTKAFEAYKKERYEAAKAAISTSRTAESLISGKGWRIRLLQNILFNWMPYSLTARMENALYGAKPQVTFLPFIEHVGEVKNPLIQKQSKRMAPESKWTVRAEAM